MKILYYTNKDISDWNVIPKIIYDHSDEVLTYTDKIDLNFLKKENIEFIVSDRARNLIKKDCIDFLSGRIVNLHPSYLPWNRGYHPNFWSVVEQTPMGVSIHYIDEQIDTGDIIVQEEIQYDKSSTLKQTYDLSRKMMVKLFANNWTDIRNQKSKQKRQSKDQGTLHLKNDFDGIYELLENGWDTEIFKVLGNKQITSIVRAINSSPEREF